MFSGYVKIIFAFVNAKIEVNFQFMECHDLSSLCYPPFPPCNRPLVYAINHSVFRIPYSLPSVAKAPAPCWFALRVWAMVDFAGCRSLTCRMGSLSLSLCLSLSLSLCHPWLKHPRLVGSRCACGQWSTLLDVGH
jgi:hypothetical protein